MKAARENQATVNKAPRDKTDRKSSWAEFHELVNEHNAKCRVNERISDKLRLGIRATWIYIAQQYLNQLDAGLATQGFMEFSTTQCALSIGDVNTSTVQRHVRKLLQLGFVTKSEPAGVASFLGNGGNRFLWINTDFVRLATTQDKPSDKPQHTESKIKPVGTEWRPAGM